MQKLKEKYETNTCMEEYQMNRTTLDEINIKNLFGRFDYEIDLRNGEDISILIAPNGCGKTTIFSIITFMFKPTLQGFRKVSRFPFDECECVLSNGKKMTLKSKKMKKAVDQRKKAYAEAIGFADQEDFNTDTEATMIRRELSLSVDGETVNYSKEIEKYLSNIDPDIIAVFEDMDYSDISFRGFSPRFRSGFEQIEQFTTGIIEILKKHNCYISVNFITADRLHTGNGASRPDRYRYRRMGYEMPIEIDDPIRKAQKNTLALYNQIREEYTSLQTKVKDELPKEYLKVTEPLWDYDDFEEKWKKYVEDIEKYCKLGLLDSSETILNVGKLKRYYDEKGAFLTVYLAAFSRTLKPLADNYEKLKLFADIFNERNRITKKTITYGRKGIILKVDDTELPLEYLSSGEKNDFVMFYDLIFNSQNNGLVLIDEPEISLHIEWQQTFLDSLIDICKMNGLQSIVATHSPNIIHGHRELFAERGIEYGSEED